jgi:hypothetical protein
VEKRKILLLLENRTPAVEPIACHSESAIPTPGMHIGGDSVHERMNGTKKKGKIIKALKIAIFYKSRDFLDILALSNKWGGGGGGDWVRKLWHKGGLFQGKVDGM